jgi:hypothetical protein
MPAILSHNLALGLIRAACGLTKPSIKRACLWLLVWIALPSQAQKVDLPIPAGSDFRVQGEYLGQSPQGDSLGVQVIAEGSGAFRCLVFAKGLPGSGWDGSPKESGTGVLGSNGQVQFTWPGQGSLTVDTTGVVIAGSMGPSIGLTAKKVVRESPTLLQSPPVGSVVLFDGKDLSAWTSAVLTTENFLLPQGTGASTGAVSKQVFTDFQMHLEFRIPFLPAATGQNRGNSGIYLQSRYELQILDSYGVWPTDTIEGSRHCGAIWEQRRPLVNACYPPYQWQTYDIDFTAARFAADGKTILEKAALTVHHNGVLIQNGWRFPGHTLLGQLEGPNAGPHRLQWHGEEVVFRNIWVLEKKPQSKIKNPTLFRLKSRKGSGVSPNFLEIYTQPGIFYSVQGCRRDGTTFTFKPGAYQPQAVPVFPGMN